MKEGSIVLFRFPYTDQSVGKLRPALVVKDVNAQFGDWLVCMISSNLDQADAETDLTILDTDNAFLETGFKMSSLFRLKRIAVMNKDEMQGSIGHVSEDFLAQVKFRLAQWIAL